MDSSSEKDVSDMMKKIGTPVLLGFGIVGNLVSMIIFSNQSLKKYTTFRLLFLLSLIDICVLLTGCGDILLQVYFDINLRLFNEYTCKIHSFMVIFFTHSSSMILLYMSVDRAIAISVVLRRSNQITGANKSSAQKSYSCTNKIVLGIFALVSLLNVHFLLFANLIPLDLSQADIQQNNQNNNNNSSIQIPLPSSSSSSLVVSLPTPISTTSDRYSFYYSYNSSHYNNDENFSASGFYNPNANEDDEMSHMMICYGKHDTFYYDYLTNYFPWVDIFFYVMFPSFVMLICSFIIISKIIYTNDRMSSYGSKAFRKRTLRNRQISYLLLTTNFLFFFMVSPLLLLNALRTIEEHTIRTTLVYMLAYSNHAFNFISYGISSERYRIELYKIIKKLLCREKKLTPNQIKNNNQHQFQQQQQQPEQQQNNHHQLPALQPRPEQNLLLTATFNNGDIIN